MQPLETQVHSRLLGARNDGDEGDKADALLERSGRCAQTSNAGLRDFVKTEFIHRSACDAVDRYTLLGTMMRRLLQPENTTMRTWMIY